MSGRPAETQTDLVVREPRNDELPRVLHLFRDTRLRKNCRFLAAERLLPIARFVGAAAWWAEGALCRFHLAAQLQAQPQSILPLVEAVLAAGRQAGLETVQYAELLPHESRWSKILELAGFERGRAERFFEIAYADAWQRTMRLHAKHRAEIPPQWRTDSIRGHRPQTILDLVAPHRLLPPEDLLRYWEVTATGGFDLDLSCILFDAEHAFGTFLVRRLPEGLFVDVQVVKEPNRLRRSLGDLCLLYHDASRVAPGGAIRWIRFRSGELEHRQTGNLALRMGGRELPRRHLFARPLNQ